MSSETRAARPRTGVRVASVAHVLPERVMTNQNLIDAYGLRLKDAWVRENLGIRERRFCAPGETTSGLAAAVCERLLERAGVGPGDIDRLILATVSPDVPTPSTACITQSLFAPGATFPCVDLVAACGGFLYALDFGRRCVQTGDRRVLVVAAEVRSAFLNKQDRRTVMLFGDGAAGVLLEPAADGEEGIATTELFADGRGWDLITVPAGGVRAPATLETVAAGGHGITMRDGGAIFQRAVDEMSSLVLRACGRSGHTLEEVDFFAFHQASFNIVRKVSEALGVPLEKTLINFDRVGNTTAASVPIVLSEAIEAGQVKPGDRVIAVSTGGGFTAGVASFRWRA